MLKNLSIKSKLISLISIFVVTFVGINLYINVTLKSQEAQFSKMQTIVKVRGHVVSTLTTGLQITSAMRGIYINNNDKKTLANLEKAVVRMGKSINALKDPELKKYSQGLEKFNILPLHAAYEKDVKRLIEVFKAGNLTDKDISTHIVTTWRPFKKKLKAYRDASKKKDTSFKKEYVENDSNIIMTLIIVSLVGIIFIIAYSLAITNSITSSLEKVKTGLDSFFAFLNKETKDLNMIDLNSDDELGQMSRSINENIQNTKKLIEEDNELILESEEVMSRVANGWLTNTITRSTSNETLNMLKENTNKMIANMDARFKEIMVVLEEYSKADYRKELKIDNLEKGGVFEQLVTNINHLQSSITNMLVENKQNGLTLDKSSDILLDNVSLLNSNANNSAAALEETAAAVEEITGNISSNTENIIKMSGYATQLSKSSSEGQSLAQNTTTSMDEINEQVTAINEAISVIDQISFQTNILSLNAAVEAATAGEAGKGFAVVAQEVRNLAARSSDAANEIKALVENANAKANEGKKIADKMIEGYTQLNENITQTIELISDVETASKEQQSGIIQINDAINSLDRQTQENASIASQTHEEAVQTDTIAKLVVSNANEKELNGKNEVVAKSVAANKTKTPTVSAPSNVNTQEVKAPTAATPQMNKVITDNSDNDEWASF